MSCHSVGHSKFHYYLVGAHFTLETDYKPLEWLESSHKSQACSQHLERWSLELRAYDFTVVHCPGKCNQTADALSHHPVNLVASNPPLDLQQLSNAQHNDSVLPSVMDQLKSTVPPLNAGIWPRFPHKRYKQLWSQLVLQDSLLCRSVYSPSMDTAKILT